MDGDKKLNGTLKTNNDDSSKKNEMEVSDSVEIDDSSRKKKFFYELGADATLKFKKRARIRVNKTMLSFHSQYFNDLFFNSSPKSEVMIDDFDYATFKLCLDCLFGFENYSAANALLIYPIAQKYNVKECLKKCVEALQPPSNGGDMNENVCLALNLALLYDCQELSSSIINYLKIKFGMDDAEVHLRKKEIFYESSADATFHFKNGDVLRANRAILAFHSKFFSKIYFGSPMKNSTDFEVEDFDSETFKIFLDCLIGVKQYTVIDSLLIYPIAHKYQISESLKNGIEELKPKEMTDNVLLTLNLALFYECNELIENVINFLKEKVNIPKLIEDENCNLLLEPAAMLKLIDNVQMDSYLWKAVYEWGKNYLTKNSKNTNVREFFEENKILEKFSLSDFESVQSIIDFHKSITNKNFLDFDEILTYFEENLLEDDGELPKKSKWVFVQAGETLEETITLKRPIIFASALSDSETKLKFEVWRNEILCYSHPNYDDADDKTVSYAVKYNFKDRHPNESFYTDDPDESEEYTSDEKIISDKSKKVICSVDVDYPEVCLEISSIECTYNFFCDCRILKTSMSENVCVNDKNLYFTNDIRLSEL